MKFPHNPQFDQAFDQIPELMWYPYVGQNVGKENARIMVFGHNAYMDPLTFADRKADFEQKHAFTGTLEEFTYERVWYTKSFRSFIKGAVNLTENYGYGSEPSVQSKIDAFVSRISYINFIQGLVESEDALSLAPPERIEQSKRISKEILGVLGITHCICWGAPVLKYITSMKGVRTVTFEPLTQPGFAYALIEDEHGHQMHVLKVFHPSMPGFKPYSAETHTILGAFLHKESVGAANAFPDIGA